MKVWAKTIVEDKITRDILFEYSSLESEDDFVAILQQICEIMDIPTPIATQVNFQHFYNFNNTRFKERDFVESIDFDVLELEAVPEKDKDSRV